MVRTFEWGLLPRGSPGGRFRSSLTHARCHLKKYPPFLSPEIQPVQQRLLRQIQPRRPLGLRVDHRTRRARTRLPRVRVRVAARRDPPQDHRRLFHGHVSGDKRAGIVLGGDVHVRLRIDGIRWYEHVHECGVEENSGEFFLACVFWRFSDEDGAGVLARRREIPERPLVLERDARGLVQERGRKTNSWCSFESRELSSKMLRGLYQELRRN